MRILLLDIETRPNLVFTWGLWNQNIAVNQIVEPAGLLCWSAQWLGEKEILFSSVHEDSLEDVVKKIHTLLDEADVVVHYNGSSFDIPRLNQEFKRLGLTPPSPYKEVDLFRVVAKKFDLPSRKLEFVVQYFGLGAKVKHPGMELWIGCMEGDEDSWKLMKKYNKGDVRLLRKLYKHILPWIDNHPTVALYTENVTDPQCPNCGSTEVQRRGVERTITMVYQRYHCSSCGKWSRSRTSIKTKEKREILRG